jgi:stage IV sporulation protein FB
MLTVFPKELLWGFSLSVLIHETGHILMIYILGFSVDRLVFMAGGIEIGMKYTPVRRLHRVLISSAGCLFNLFSSLAVFLAVYFYPHLKPRLEGFFFYSAIMCVFNSLPIKGLDGGAVLDQIFDRLFLPDTAYSLTKAVSLLFTFFLWILACYILFTTGNNLSLFMVCAALFCTFLKSESV